MAFDSDAWVRCLPLGVDGKYVDEVPNARTVLIGGAEYRPDLPCSWVGTFFRTALLAVNKGIDSKILRSLDLRDRYRYGEKAINAF